MAAWALPSAEPQPAETPSIWDSAASEAPDVSPKPERKIFPVTAENLRARVLPKNSEAQEQSKTVEVQPTQGEASNTNRRPGDSGAHSTTSAEEKNSRAGSTGSADSSGPVSESVSRHDDSGQPSRSIEPREKVKNHHQRAPLGVILTAGELPGEPGAQINRLANSAGSYTAVDASNPIYSFDQAVVFKKAYALKNPCEERVYWDFYGPPSSEPQAKTSRHSTASVEFIYTSRGRRSTHKDATFSLETRVYDQNSPGGRRVSKEESSTQLEQMVAYAGLATPTEGAWRWRETRGHGQSSESTFEVRKAPSATGAWVRRISGKYQVILAPFVAHAGDDWLVHNKSYALPSLSDSCFQAEWNWFAPDASLNRNFNHAYLTVRMNYQRDSGGYHLTTRVFDPINPRQGRLVDRKSGRGSLAESTLTYGKGLPVPGAWRLQEKIDGVETELLTLQERQLLVAVQSPKVLYADNGHQVFKMTLASQPSTYQVKKFNWILELHNANSRALLRRYRGSIDGNTKQAVGWEQDWDGRDLSGNLVAPEVIVSPELGIEVPSNPNEVVVNLETAVHQRSQEVRTVPQCQIESLPFKEGYRDTCTERRHGNHKRGQSGGQGSSGGSGGGFNWILSTRDPLVGIAHPGKMIVVLGGTRRQSYADELAMTAAYQGGRLNNDVDGHLVYESADWDSALWRDQPVLFSTPDGHPPALIQILWLDQDPDTGDYYPTCGSFSEIFLFSGDATYSERLIKSSEEYAADLGIPPNACFDGPILVPTQVDVATGGGATSIDELVNWPDTPAGTQARLEAGAILGPNLSRYGVCVRASTVQLSVMSGFQSNEGATNSGLFSATGMQTHRETDLAIKTRSVPFALTRYWHSGGDGLSLGSIYPTGQNLLRYQFGWIWSFQRELNFYQNGTVCAVIKPEGGQDVFSKDSSGQWVAARADVTDRLTTVDFNHFQVETKDHFFRVYQLSDGISAEDSNARAFLTEERDMHNNRLRYSWDPRGDRLNEVRDSDNRVLATFTWGLGELGSPDAWLQLREVRDFTQRVVSYTYKPAPVPYHHRGYLKSVIQPGNVTLTYNYKETSYLHDAEDLARRGMGLAVVAVGVPDALLGTSARISFYSNVAHYAMREDLIEVVRNGISELKFSAPEGTVERKEYTEDNLFTTRRDTSPIPGREVRLTRSPVANPTDVRNVDFSFDPTGKASDIWDHQGNRRQFVFDQASNLTRYTNALNEQWNFVYDDHRNVQQAIDPAGHSTSFDYDERDRLVRTVDHLGYDARMFYDAQDDLIVLEDKENQQTRFSYNNLGLLTSMTNALGSTWTCSYDVLGFLNRVDEPAVHGQQAVWEFTNDALGRTTSESLDGNVLKRTVYDVRDRVTSSTLLESAVPGQVPNSRTMSYVFNAFDQVVTTTDPLNRISTNFFDTNQRYLRTQRPDGTFVGRTYNTQGEVATHYNGSGVSTQYYYDELHRLVRMVHPGGGGEERFTHNAKGQVKSWLKIDGTLVEYYYNALGQPNRVVSGGQELVYTYDVLNRLSNVRADLGTTTYTYSPESDLLSVIDVHGRRIQYGYDAAHQLTSRTDPEGLRTLFERDALGQVSQASCDGLACSYIYNTHGDLTRAVWNTGFQEAFDYSSQGEVVARNSQAPGAQFERETNVLDGLGRKSSTAFAIPNGFRNHSYTYDLIGQLTNSRRQVNGAGGTTTKAYGYDHNFNRTANNLLTATYSAADRITALSGFQTPQYTGAGAIGRDQQGATLSYDWRDQLLSYSKPGSSAQYKYDANNLRMEKNVNGTKTQYLWEGSQVLKEYNGDGSVKASYFLGIDRGAIKTAGQWYLYLTDTHGSVTGLLDTAGNRVATYTFGDYGDTLTEQGTVYNPFRWNGEQLDAESGLYYLRNRYYQPSTGRFMQRDPIGYEGGLNLYAYCNGDPINASDPSGLEQIYPDESKYPSQELQDFRQEYHWPNATTELMHNQIEWESNPWNQNTLHILRFRPVMGGGRYRGSGPAKGVIEVSGRYNSTKAFRGFVPSRGNGNSYLFDPVSNRLVTSKGGPHIVLHMKSKIANPRPVGGNVTKRQGASGYVFEFDENSGHYGQNWTDPIRAQFKEFLNLHGIDAEHTPWGSP